MPSEKRSHGRITSGNVRPHKSARFGQESGSSGDLVANECTDNDLLMEETPFISAVPICQSANNQIKTEYSSMRVAQVVAWPANLAAIRTHFYYNLTPHEGYHLPDDILQAISSRIVQPISRKEASNTPRRLSYIHLGFTTFLDLQIFVLLPNLRLDTLPGQRNDHIQESILERWTDTVLLPSLSRKDPRAPSSWRLANLYKHSPAWFDEDLAPFPVHKVYNSQDNELFARIWRSIQDLSMNTHEFQHPFLLFYSNGDCPQLFCGDGPEGAMRDFETAWHKCIDMHHIPWPDDNLRVDFDHSNRMEIRDLPMR